MVGHLELLPAVDVRAGRAVQLVSGDVASIRDFGDPLEAALRWQSAGAPWIHLVDLDAALAGTPDHDLMAAIIGRLDIPVQLSGGIVDDDGLTSALASGCRRVVLGTAALRDAAWCTQAIGEHGERVVVGLDVRGETLRARGSGIDVGPVRRAVRWLDRAGCPRYVVTDVERDGALSGPNLELLRDLAGQTDASLVACGGITGLGDIEALRSLGVEGAIVGSAIAEGRFTVEEAVAVATG